MAASLRMRMRTGLWRMKMKDDGRWHISVAVGKCIMIMHTHAIPIPILASSMNLCVSPSKLILLNKY